VPGGCPYRVVAIVASQMTGSFPGGAEGTEG
jgi:hypothetical protein